MKALKSYASINVRNSNLSIILAVLILLFTLILTFSAPAIANVSNSTLFNIPISVAATGEHTGELYIKEVSPGTLTAGQDIKLTFLNIRLNNDVSGEYPGENLQGKAGAWIYAPAVMGNDTNTIKSVNVVSQTHNSVTVRIESVEKGDRACLGIRLYGEGKDQAHGTIRPGNVIVIISSTQGVEFVESEELNARKSVSSSTSSSLSYSSSLSTSSIQEAKSDAKPSFPGITGSNDFLYESPAWPKLSYNNSSTGTSPYKSSPAAVKWVVKLDDFGGMNNCTFREAPVIGKNNIIYATGQSWSTWETSVYAIYPDGSLKWRTVLSSDWDEIYWSSLTLSDDGRLYIGTSWYGRLYCIDEETGVVHWVYTAPKGPPESQYKYNDIYSPPIIHPETGDIIFSTWALICLNREGQERWRYYDGSVIYEHFAAISPHNGLIYFCDWGLPGAGYNCRIQAVDINGNRVYSYTFPNNKRGRDPDVGDRSAPIILSNGNVLITGSDDICACLTPELQPIWITDFYPSWLCSITPSALSPDESIWYIQSWGSKVSAVETATGKILWDIDFRQALNEKLGTAFNRYSQESGLSVESGGKVLVNAYPSGLENQVLFTMDSSGQIIDALLITPPEGINSLTQPSIAPDGTVYLGDWYSGYFIAVSSRSELDKSHLGKRPYCLYGKGSVNLSTGNFILEETDLAVPSTGPALELTRFYNSADTYEGPLGKGWTHNYNTHLTINNDQSITVAYADGHTALFTCEGGGYLRPAGCFETLAAGLDSTFTLAFKDQTKHTYNAAGQLISITDKNNNTLTLNYTDGLLSSVTGPAGRTLNFSYNAERLLTGLTDPAGRAVTYDYDSSGNLSTVQDVLGGITRYSYDTLGLTGITAPDGNSLLTNQYDSGSRVTRQADGGGNATGFNYDLSGRRTSMTDAGGHVINAGYDQKYRCIAVTFPGNITEAYTYDDNNCRESLTDTLNRTTSFSYDQSGNLLTVTDPAGNTTSMSYDSHNNLLWVKNALGKQIDFSCDANSNLQTMSDPYGNTTSYDYYHDGLIKSKTTPADDTGPGLTHYTYQDGLLTTVTNPAGNTTTFSYDPAGWPRTITDPDGRITTLNYDNAGNLLDITDPMGHKTIFTYDWRGQILTETDPRGNVTRYEYNGNGNLITLTDAMNHQTIYKYNLLNQLEKITDPRGYSTIFSYDPLGRLTGITDPLGHNSSFHYDNVGNLTGKTDAHGKRVLTVEYDSLNNPKVITDALGNTARNDYDSLSRLTTFTDPMGYVTGFDYDDLNRLKTTTDSLSGRGSQEFDRRGNRKVMVDPNTNRTSFGYDTYDRLTERITAANGVTSLSYNSRNLVAWKSNARGQATTYEYDNAGRLISFTGPDGTVSLTYDQNSNLLTATDSAGTTAFEYDALNRIKKYTDTRGKVIVYAYDANGNLNTLTYPGGKKVNYDYNAANRMTTVTDWAGRVTAYEYDFNGRLKKTVQPNGTITSRTYDEAGRVKQIKDASENGAVISQYDFSYDASGNITEEKGSHENVPFTMNDAELTYAEDNRLATYNGQTVLYDADGNMTSGPLSGTMANFTYDSRGRLTAAGNISYTYDADSNRIGASNRDKQTNYTVNPNASLSQVLIRTDEQNRETYYVYGLGLIGQESAGGAYRTYHYDYRGSAVALTDEGGTVTDRFLYAPFGEMVYRSGNTDTPFLFCGQYGIMTDAADLYYMRARYYNPVAKRFLSPDTLLGDVSNPQSQNLYVYCKGNPVLRVDPSGNSDIVGFIEDYNLEYDLQFNRRYVYPAVLTVGEAAVDAITIVESGGFAIPIVLSKKAAKKGAGEALKGAGKTGVIEQHHLLPQQFKKQFEKAGLDIEKYKIPLEKVDHRLKPDGLHTGTNNWNKQWDDFFKQNPDAIKPEILDQLDKMKKAFGLS